MPGLLFALALAIRMLLILQTNFDGLYGQDAFAYYNFAGELLNFVQTGSAPGPFFWPIGYPMILALGFSVLGTSTSSSLVLNILMGALLPVLVYLLARQLKMRLFSAITAGLVMLVCGQALQSSLVLMADIPALFWATLSALALLRYMNTQRRHWIALAAALFALAIINRWLYLTLAIPWALATLLSWRKPILWKRVGLDVIVALVAGLIVLTPQLIYGQFNPQQTLRHPWVLNWSISNAWQTTFDNIDGHFEYEKINALFYARPFYDPIYLSPLLLLFVLAGIRKITIKSQRVSILLIGGWLVIPYLFLSGIPYQNIRFPLIIFPAIALCVGYGVETLLSTQIAQKRRVAAGILVTLLVFFGLGQMATHGDALIRNFIVNQQRNKQIVEWAASKLPEGARLYTFGLTLTLQHYTLLDVYELYYETPSTLNQRWRNGQDDYLLINVYNVESQWQGRAPSIAYHWLQQMRGLIKLGDNAGYTLYRVAG